MITCELNDYIDAFKGKIKAKLSPLFNSVPVHEIIVRDRSGNIINPDFVISSFKESMNSSTQPFLIDMPISAHQTSKCTITGEIMIV